MEIEEMILTAISESGVKEDIGVLISEDTHRALAEELRAKDCHAEGRERSKLRGVHYSIIPEMAEPGFRIGRHLEIMEEARILLNGPQSDYLHADCQL